MTILLTAVVSFVLALLLGFLLGFFKKMFAVQVDPLIENVRAALPGANCGACGYPGCDGFAAAVAAGNAPVDGCSAGGKDTATAVATVMGVTANAEQYYVVLGCRGTKECAQVKGEYVGVKDCRAAKIATNGIKVCSWGCMGFGNCVSVCRFGALTMGADGLPHVDKEKCTGCGMCAKECPQKLFTRPPVTREGAIALCSNRSQNKPSVIKACKNGCIKCGKCERVCTQKAIVVTNGIPVVDYALCTSCGDCIKGCPTHVLKLLQD